MMCLVLFRSVFMIFLRQGDMTGSDDLLLMIQKSCEPK